MAETVYILLGSNLGDRERNMTRAMEELTGVPGLEIVAASSIYLTEAEGMDEEAPSFLNQVVKGDYDYLPNELLVTLERIEKRLGRSDKGQKQPRTIDLDILLFGEQIIETEQLSIPHRELLNRAFAMVPLLQIDPEIVHPVTRRPVAEFLEENRAHGVLLFKDYVARHI
jgi:2-amino-4-hydroxy-6-hydroxymethyldihydropteridine diphosphokinase